MLRIYGFYWIRIGRERVYGVFYDGGIGRGGEEIWFCFWKRRYAEGENYYIELELYQIRKKSGDLLGCECDLFK